LGDFVIVGEMEPPGLGLVLELVDQHNDFYSQPGRSFSIAVSWETIFPLAHMCGLQFLFCVLESDQCKADVFWDLPFCCLQWFTV
jgi:hypothetical protein